MFLEEYREPEVKLAYWFKSIRYAFKVFESKRLRYWQYSIYSWIYLFKVFIVGLLCFFSIMRIGVEIVYLILIETRIELFEHEHFYVYDSKEYKRREKE